MVVKRALAESRPWLLISLIFGIGYLLVRESEMPGLYQIAWKGAAVGALVPYALIRHYSLDAKLIAAVLALSAAGDMAIEVDLIAGGVCFSLAYLTAIALYARHRRAKTSASQKLLAFVMVPLVAIIAFMLPADRVLAPGVALYGGIVAAMAAMAWTSAYPRYRVGIGAVMLVASDLFLFAGLGPLEGAAIQHWAVWPLYYFGQFLVALGVIQSLRLSLPRR